MDESLKDPLGEKGGVIHIDSFKKEKRPEARDLARDLMTKAGAFENVLGNRPFSDDATFYTFDTPQSAKLFLQQLGGTDEAGASEATYFNIKRFLSSRLPFAYPKTRIPTMCQPERTGEGNRRGDSVATYLSRLGREFYTKLGEEQIHFLHEFRKLYDDDPKKFRVLVPHEENQANRQRDGDKLHNMLHKYFVDRIRNPAFNSFLDTFVYTWGFEDMCQRWGALSHFQNKVEEYRKRNEFSRLAHASKDMRFQAGRYQVCGFANPLSVVWLPGTLDNLFNLRSLRVDMLTIQVKWHPTYGSIVESRVTSLRFETWLYVFMYARQDRDIGFRVHIMECGHCTSDVISTLARWERQGRLKDFPLQRIWIHANVVKADNHYVIPENPLIRDEYFVRDMHMEPNITDITISLGWTTGNTPSSATFTSSDIKHMDDVLNRIYKIRTQADRKASTIHRQSIMTDSRRGSDEKVSPSVVIALRASMAHSAQSWPELLKMARDNMGEYGSEQRPGLRPALYMWNKCDNITVADLKWLGKHYPVCTTFYNFREGIKISTHDTPGSRVYYAAENHQWKKQWVGRLAPSEDHPFEHQEPTAVRTGRSLDDQSRIQLAEWIPVRYSGHVAIRSTAIALSDGAWAVHRIEQDPGVGYLIRGRALISGDSSFSCIVRSCGMESMSKAMHDGQVEFGVRCQVMSSGMCIKSMGMNEIVSTQKDFMDNALVQPYYFYNFTIKDQGAAFPIEFRVEICGINKAQPLREFKVEVLKQVVSYDRNPDKWRNYIVLTSDKTNPVILDRWLIQRLDGRV